MKIIDSFIFFNELDLLEARLEYLYESVDHFILIEANHTFAGKPKQFFFEENKERFSKYAEKITAVKYFFPENCDYSNSWDLWKLQTDYIVKCIEPFSEHDIIYVSDLDEIPNIDKLGEVRTLMQDSTQNMVISPLMDCFYYNLSTKTENYSQPYWISPYFAKKSVIKQKGAYNIRFRSDHYNKFLEEVSDLDQLALLAEKSIFDPEYEEVFLEAGGWHLTYFMTEEQIRLKLESFAHTEFNTDQIKNSERLKRCITEKKDLFGREGHNMSAITPEEYFSKHFLQCFNKWNF